MLKTFKWLYKLGQDRTRHDLLQEIEKAQTFHLKQAEVARRRANSEFDKPRISANEHELAAQTLYDLLTHLDPKRYRNLDKLFREML